MLNKTFHLLLLLLIPILGFSQANSQYPDSGNKIRLGFQTTADGLIWRDTQPKVGGYQPINNKAAWVVLDTVNNKLYHYKNSAWTLVGGDTTSLSNRIDLRLKIADTTNILTNYYRSGRTGIIQASDVPTLNQNTTGSAATLTTSRTFQTNLASTSTASFNGSANVTPGVTGTLAVANGGTGTTSFSPNNYLIRTNSSGIFDTSAIYEAGGNVGIGTTSPEGKLTVQGISAQPLVSGTTANSLLQLKGSLGNELNIGSNTALGDYGSYIQSSDNNLAVPYNLFLQPNGGNVGIGTASPAQKLDIRGGTSGSSNRLQVYHDYSTVFLQLYTGVDNETSIISNSFLTFASGSLSSERMRITSTGNVGIGTTNPTALLSIQRGASGDNMEFIGSGASGYSDILFYNTSKATRLGYIDWSNTQVRFNVEANIPLAFHTNTIERMRITNDGNVGIGTASPISKLDINSSTNALNVGNSRNSILALSTFGKTVTSGYSTSDNYLQIGAGENAIGSTRLIGFGYSVNALANQPAYIGYIETANQNNTKGSLIFGTRDVETDVAPTERMRITSGGVLCVGTGTVLGGGGAEAFNGFNVTSSGIIVNNSIADYNAYFAKRSGYSQNGLIAFYVANSLVGSISTNGTTTSYNVTSDYRLKEDFKDFNGLDLIDSIKIYDYQWKSDKSRMYGVVAHELQEVIPYAVQGKKDEKEMQGVDYSKLVPILIKSVQELSAQVDILKQEIINLKNK